VAIFVRDQEQDIWIWHLARETLTRLTLDPATDAYPVWMPDGRRLVFSSARSGATNLFLQAADGTGAVERLSENLTTQFPYAVSPDGRHLVFRGDFPKTGQDLMVLTLRSDERRPAQPPSQGLGESGRSSKSEVRPPSQGFGEPRPLVQTTFQEINGEISPDGRWLAYQSNESGRDEIFVQPFPDVGGGRWQISTGVGGTRPLWARSGRELFYLTPTGVLMRVPIEPTASFAAGTPAKLLDGRYHFEEPGRTYDVSPDGRRFLMIKSGDGSDKTAAPANLIVVQNWVEELKRLVPSRQ